MRKKKGIRFFGLIIGILYVGTIFINQRISAYKLNEEIKRQQTEFDKVKEINQQLQDEVDISKTDIYMEKLARERLGLIKEGETPVIHNTKDK